VLMEVVLKGGERCLRWFDESWVVQAGSCCERKYGSAACAAASSESFAPELYLSLQFFNHEKTHV
jgi:hypothetical protein